MAGKLIAEFITFVLMFLACAYHMTGNLAHEVIGVAILFMALIHNIQNRRWYRALFKFKDGINGLLFFNFLLIASMSTAVISGILISHDLFFFLPVETGFGTRQIHMAAAYWVLIFMAVHLGLYWGRISGWLKRFELFAATWPFLRKAGPFVLVTALVLGTKASFERSIASKLFLGQAFDFWDFNEPYIYQIWLNFIIAVMYISLAHYAAKLPGIYLKTQAGVNHESIIGKRKSS